MDILEIARLADGTREDLDNLDTFLHGIVDFGRSEATGKIRDVDTLAEFVDTIIEARTDDELCTLGIGKAGSLFV